MSGETRPCAELRRRIRRVGVLVRMLPLCLGGFFSRGVKPSGDLTCLQLYYSLIQPSKSTPFRGALVGGIRSRLKWGGVGGGRPHIVTPIGKEV